MGRRSFTSGRRELKIALFFAGCLALLAQGPVPRPAPELKIGTGTLSSWREHVVLLAFISTHCPHCQRASVVFEQLSHEFPQLRVAEVAFDEGADTAGFAKKFALSFPVGTGTSDLAHDFLGIARGARLGTPQVVAIDKKGVIRAQSERLGSPILQTHDYLRDLLRAMGAQ
jgi:thiol-disulfide isomerase/thioredoxin